MKKKCSALYKKIIVYFIDKQDVFVHNLQVFDIAVQVCNDAISPLTCVRQSRNQYILETLIAAAKSMSKRIDSQKVLDRFKNL